MCKLRGLWGPRNSDESRKGVTELILTSFTESTMRLGMEEMKKRRNMEDEENPLQGMTHIYGIS